MMKKLLYVIIAFCMSVMIAGCGANSSDDYKIQKIKPESNNPELPKENNNDLSKEEPTEKPEIDYIQEIPKEETEGTAVKDETVEENDSKDNSSQTAIISTPNDQTDLLEAIKVKYEFPFKLWGPEGMELYCIYIYEDHAKRDWSSDSEQTCHDNLLWNVSGNQLNISGTWTESFTIDLEAETATSVESGKVYRIVKGLSQ